jgi:hypothetical protein
MFKRFLILLACGVLAVPVFAQTRLGETYTSDDGEFSFDYADGLTMQVGVPESTTDIGEFYIDPETPMRVKVSPPIPVTTFDADGMGTTPATITTTRLRLWRQIAPVMTAGVIDVPDGAFADPLATVETYTIDGREAAYVTQVYQIDDTHSAAVVLITVEMDANMIVTITASPSLAGGAELAADYQQDILAIAQSLQYQPELDASTTNADSLPTEYIGQIGNIQTGELRFFYPKAWYILPVSGNIFVTNNDRLVNGTLEPGMLQTNVIPPDFNKTGFADMEAVGSCNLSPAEIEAITPIAVLEQQMLSEERLISYEEQGATYHEPEAIILNERDAAYMRLFTAERDALVIAVDMGDGNVVSIMAFAYVGEMAQYDDTLFALAGTFDYTHQGCETE